ncbi:hypothetical protein HY633_00350 [Candidatus Uhrbacteria bacterium]|nr:hypothetical protein [Candidatus Uhrbacteria bacterium]
MSRKAFTVTVVTATIAWSVGLAALLAPLTAKAAPAAGTLVKSPTLSAAVYYVGGDGKRYVFPNEKTYKTWYADFSQVVTITPAELTALGIGGNVTYKPGAKMVKITTDPKVYAVGKGGALRWVTSEAVAVALYGSAWNTKIDDVPDAFFTNYKTGTDITSSGDFSPAGESSQATSINDDKGLVGQAGTGSLAASLTSDQPMGGSLPKGATAVNVLKVSVKNNGSTSMTVDSLTVHRSGNGVTADIANAYVYAGNDRLTTGRTFNSTTHDASFSGLNLALAAGEMKSVWVGVDFAAGALAANQHAFSLTDLKAGTTTASGIPLAGPTWTISNASAGSVTVNKSGTITNPKAGQLGAKVAEFQLQAGASEDIDFAKIALYHGGSVSRDKYSNFVLKQAGSTLATVSTLNGKDLAVFVLATPMLIEKGNTKTFEVFADLAGSARSAETVKFYVDQTTDVLAMGKTYNAGVSVTTNGGSGYDGTTCTSAAGKCSYSTVDAGQLTVTFNGPAAKDIGSNSKDVELFNFTMAAGSNLEVRKMQLVVDGNGDLDDGATTSPRLTDIKVVDVASGATVMGPKDSVNGTGYAAGNNASTLDFTEVFSLAPGQARTFKVTADVANDATLTGGQNLTTVKVTLKKFSALSSAIRNLDSSQDLAAADYVPDADTAGNTHNLKSPTLTYSLASSPVSQTYIQGTQNANIFGLSLKAGDATDVKVSTLTLTAYVDSDTSGTFTKGSDTTATASDQVLTAKLWNGTTQISTTKSPTSGTGGVMTFDNMNLVIAKGQTVTLTLSANFAASIASVAASSDRIKIDLANRTEVTDGGGAAGTCDNAADVCTTSDISATDPDGNSVTPLTTGLLNQTTVDAGTRMTIAAAGTVAVVLAPDDTESEAGLVIGGSSNAVLGKFKVSATNEELKMTKALLRVATAPTGVTSLSIYDGSTLVGGPSAVDGLGQAFFTGMTGFVIPKDGNKTFTVKGNLNSVGSSGAAIGSNVVVTLKNTTDTEFRGTSAGSSTIITSISSDKVGNAKHLVKSKPTVSLVALPTSVLSAGDAVVQRFTVSADAAGDVALKALTFTLSKTTLITVAVTATSSIRRVGDGTNLAGTAALDGSCNAAATACTVYTDFGTGATGEEVVAAGTSKTYDLRLTLGAIPSGSASVSVNLGSDAAAEYGAVTAATGPAKAKLTTDPGVLVWSDNSSSAHTAAYAGSSTDWATGKYVKSTPTDGQTLSK